MLRHALIYIYAVYLHTREGVIDMHIGRYTGYSYDHTKKVFLFV